MEAVRHGLFRSELAGFRVIPNRLAICDNHGICDRYEVIAMNYLVVPLLLSSLCLYGNPLHAANPGIETLAWTDSGRAQERRASEGAQQRRASQGARERQASQGAEPRRVSRGAQERRTSQGAEERRQGTATPRH